MDRLQRHLRTTFHYNRGTGELIWKTGCNKGKVGFSSCTPNRSGTQGTAYYDGSKKTLRLQRAVWIWHNSEPERNEYVITIDGDVNNTRIENLELVDAAMSRSIRHHGPNKNNSTGVRGVHPASETAFTAGWEADITDSDGIRRSRFFEVFSEAVAWRESMVKRYYPKSSW